MTNLDRLKLIINYQGIKLSVLAYRIGISRTTLWSRLNGTSEFTTDEIKMICKVLHLNEKERERIFNITNRDYIRK